MEVYKKTVEELGSCQFCSTEAQPIHWPKSMVMHLVKVVDMQFVICMICRIDLIKKLRNPTQ